MDGSVLGFQSLGSVPAVAQFPIVKEAFVSLRGLTPSLGSVPAVKHFLQLVAVVGRSIRGRGGCFRGGARSEAVTGRSTS